MQHKPAVWVAAHELLERYPKKACKQPVEDSPKRDHLPYSPRPSPAQFASPHHDRIRSSYKSTPPSRQANGPSVDRKPAEKDSDKPLGRIVDWVSPVGYKKGASGGYGDKAGEQSSKGAAKSQEKPSAGMLGNDLCAL